MSADPDRLARRYPEPASLERAARPQRTRCPSCRLAVRVGYRGGQPVVGQHWRPAHPGPTVDGEHGDCCACPGSWEPVAESDAWDFTQTRALAATTGQMAAVPAAHPAAAPGVPAPRQGTWSAR